MIFVRTGRTPNDEPKRAQSTGGEIFGVSPTKTAIRELESHSEIGIVNVKLAVWRRMYSVVLDTNVLIAALRSRYGASFRLLSLIGDPRWQPVISVALVLEYESVAKRGPSFVDEWVVDAVVDMLCAKARRSAPYFRWRPFLRDPADEFILDLAIGSQCDFIVTHNARDFVGVDQFRIGVLRPGEFLRIIGEEP